MATGTAWTVRGGAELIHAGCPAAPAKRFGRTGRSALPGIGRAVLPRSPLMRRQTAPEGDAGTFFGRGWSSRSHRAVAGEAGLVARLSVFWITPGGKEVKPEICGGGIRERGLVLVLDVAPQPDTHGVHAARHASGVSGGNLGRGGGRLAGWAGQGPRRQLWDRWLGWGPQSLGLLRLELRAELRGAQRLSRQGFARRGHWLHLGRRRRFGRWRLRLLRHRLLRLVLRFICAVSLFSHTWSGWRILPSLTTPCYLNAKCTTGTPPDNVCAHFKDPGDYDYRPAREVAEGDEDTEVRSVIDVDILGHIFEQSITNLERLRLSLVRSGVSGERRCLGFRKLAAFCRDAATNLVETPKPGQQHETDAAGTARETGKNYLCQKLSIDRAAPLCKRRAV